MRQYSPTDGRRAAGYSATVLACCCAISVAAGALLCYQFALAATVRRICVSCFAESPEELAHCDDGQPRDVRSFQQRRPRSTACCGGPHWRCAARRPSCQTAMAGWQATRQRRAAGRWPRQTPARISSVQAHTRRRCTPLGCCTTSRRSGRGTAGIAAMWCSRCSCCRCTPGGALARRCQQATAQCTPAAFP
jgi:hypothetical protein